MPEGVPAALDDLTTDSLPRIRLNLKAINYVQIFPTSPTMGNFVVIVVIVVAVAVLVDQTSTSQLMKLSFLTITNSY